MAHIVQPCTYRSEEGSEDWEDRQGGPGRGLACWKDRGRTQRVEGHREVHLAGRGSACWYDRGRGSAC